MKRIPINYQVVVIIIVIFGLVVLAYLYIGGPAQVCDSMTLEEAKQIAIASECGDMLIEGTQFCNSDTHTWWIDLDIEKEGCNPACVINTETKEAEINWRCTGVVIE